METGGILQKIPPLKSRSAMARRSERQGVAKEARRPGETVDEETQRTRQDLGTKRTFRRNISINGMRLGMRLGFTRI